MKRSDSLESSRMGLAIIAEAEPRFRIEYLGVLTSTMQATRPRTKERADQLEAHKPLPSAD